MPVTAIIRKPKGRPERRPSESWFAARTLGESRAWLKAAENYERCGFGTPKLRYIAERMRQRIAGFESKAPDVLRCSV
jgi:hypothetical protein